MELEKDKQGVQLHLLPRPSSDNKPNSNSNGTRPKRFIKSQIPDSILNDPVLNAAISILPSNYNFEVHKCVWRVLSPPKLSASLSNSLRASSCTLSPYPTSSPPSPVSLTASSSATSLTALVVSTTSPPSHSAPIFSFTTVTTASYPLIPPPSLAFTSLLISKSTSTISLIRLGLIFNLAPKSLSVL